MVGKGSSREASHSTDPGGRYFTGKHKHVERSGVQLDGSAHQALFPEHLVEARVVGGTSGVLKGLLA